MYGVRTMSNRIVRFFWGELSPDELKKFSLLALGFFFIIGSWWPLKTLKDTIFLAMVGVDYQPNVKIASVMLFFPLVLLYSRLVDYVTKERLIYLFVAFYGTLGLVFVYFLQHPTIGISNTVTDPTRIFGWLFYLFAESYISLALALYWSFTNDITTPESAQKGYGLLIFGNQLGGFLATLLGHYASRDASLFTHRAPLIALCSVLTFFLVGLVVYILEHNVSQKNLQSYEEKAVSHHREEAVGFFDGLRALFTHPYVTGIFGIIFFQEVISGVMNFQMLKLVNNTFTSAGMMNKFLFDFALAVQIISALFALFGTSFFQRRFGMTFCLVAYPLFLGCIILVYLSMPTLSTIFYVVLSAKALSYVLNQPAKEVLYIPTSRSIKYKSKAWIDMFGLRFSKACCSVINDSMGSQLVYLGGFSLGVIGLWIFMATILGATFNKAIKNKTIVE